MFVVRLFFLFKQKTAYEMRISDWSSDVCSSDLRIAASRRASCATTSASRAEKGQSSACARISPTAPPRVIRRNTQLPSRRRSTIPASTNLRTWRDTRDRKTAVKGKRVSDRDEIGGRSCIKKKKPHKNT